MKPGIGNREAGIGKAILRIAQVLSDFNSSCAVRDIDNRFSDSRFPIPDSRF
jgi:hypothetical protein